MNGLTSVITGVLETTGKASDRLLNGRPGDGHPDGVRSPGGVVPAEAPRPDPRPGVRFEPRDADPDRRRTWLARVLQRGRRGDPRAAFLCGGRDASRRVGRTVLAAHARLGAAAARAPARR